MSLVIVALALFAFSPPRPQRLAHDLIKGGASAAVCIEPARGEYVCTYDYRGRCSEIEAHWNGKRAVVTPFASRRGWCKNLPRPKKSPAA